MKYFGIVTLITLCAVIFHKKIEAKPNKKLYSVLDRKKD